MTQIWEDVAVSGGTASVTVHDTVIHALERIYIHNYSAVPILILISHLFPVYSSDIMSPSATPTPEDNLLFPKITGKHGDFIHNINKVRHRSPELLIDMEQLQMIGHVKLHGAHNDIVVHSDDSIQLQSRNIEHLSLQKDSHEFAKNMLPKRAGILRLKKRIHDRFKEKNPGIEIDATRPLIIGGEWCGPGVQKDVAISDLPKRILVVISISINGVWVPDDDYGDIFDADAGIYHIAQGGVYTHSLPIGLGNEAMAESLEKLQPLADAIEDECPFAKTFGLVGQGEGLVFKPLGPLGQDAKYWLKVKGPISRLGGRAPKPHQMPTKNGKQVDPLQLAKDFATATATEPRLEQAWDYLRETGAHRTNKGMGGHVGKFLEWLAKDIEAEEKTAMRELGIDRQLAKDEIKKIGRGWFIRRVQSTK